MKKEKSCSKKSKGFTLIEVLVVVLIIGILAAIALPQYKKAVLKSKFATIKDRTRVIYEAEQRYYLINNSYTTNWDDLDIANVNINTKEYSCDIGSSSVIYCSLKIDSENFLQYVILTKTQQRRCDATPGDPNNLVNKICQIDTGKPAPESNCGVFCAYYY